MQQSWADGALRHMERWCQKRSPSDVARCLGPLTAARRSHWWVSTHTSCSGQMPFAESANVRDLSGLSETFSPPGADPGFWKGGGAW